MSTAHGAVSKDYLPFQNALASLLLDEEQGGMVCDAILGRSVGSHSSVAATEELAAFFPSCSVPRTYAAVIHNWISTQMQPLLSYRPHHSFPSGTSSSSSSSGGGGGSSFSFAGGSSSPCTSPYAAMQPFSFGITPAAYSSAGVSGAGGGSGSGSNSTGGSSMGDGDNGF